MKKVLLLSAFVLLSCLTPSAQVVAPASPEAGFAPDRLARIDRVFQQFVDENRLGGAVTLVLRDGKPVYERAFGWKDKEAGRAMTTDSDVSHRLADEGLDERRDPLAGRRGKDRVERSGRSLHSCVSQHDGCRRRRGRSEGRSRQASDHDPRPADAHGGHLLWDQRARGLPVRGKGSRACRWLGLVYGGQGRADLHDDGAARDAAVRRPARRGVGLWLQH